MHEKEINKFICYGVGIVVVYYIVSAFISYIILAVVGMVVWRLYQDRHKF